MLLQGVWGPRDKTDHPLIRILVFCGRLYIYKANLLQIPGSGSDDTVRIRQGSCVDPMCFVSPRESYRARHEWCLSLRCSSWAPCRWAHEMLCCPPSQGWGIEGERKGHTCHQSCRVSWDPLLQDEPNRQEEHGAKAKLKASSVPNPTPPHFERVAMESKGRSNKGLDVWCHDSVTEHGDISCQLWQWNCANGIWNNKFPMKK